jgi:hypothetical protein
LAEGGEQILADEDVVTPGRQFNLHALHAGRLGNLTRARQTNSHANRGASRQDR